MADPDPMTCDPGSRVYDPDPGTVIPDPIYLVTTLRKGDCHFRAHGRTMCLKAVFSIKLERIFLEN